MTARLPAVPPSGAPRIPHGPPPLELNMTGIGVSAYTFSLGKAVCAEQMRIVVAGGEITTVEIDMEGETAIYEVSPDFQVSGTVRLVKTVARTEETKP